jgi:hypothetical protein
MYFGSSNIARCQLRAGRCARLSRIIDPTTGQCDDRHVPSDAAGLGEGIAAAADWRSSRDDDRDG